MFKFAARVSAIVGSMGVSADLFPKTFKTHMSPALIVLCFVVAFIFMYIHLDINGEDDD